MPKGKLDPSVEEFKLFVKKHPFLIKEVRQGKTTWQELYEEWYLLGEDDPKWNDYTAAKNQSSLASDKTSSSTKENKNDFIESILNRVKKMDPEQVQQYAEQLNQAIGTVIELLNEFKSSQEKPNYQTPESDQERPNPFLFRRD